MGILRADRVSGLGGANAINGSVRFGNDGSSTNTRGTSLNIAGSGKSDLNFAGNDFTFEAWVYPADNVQWNALYCQSWGLQIYINTADASGSYVKIYVGSDDTGNYAISGATSAYASVTADQWNHIAFSRNGNSWTIFTNGTAATSSTNSQSLIPSNADYTIGIFNSIGATTDSNSYFGFKGYISNLRIRTGAHYTASFTPPTTRLEKTSDTVLLCCQSPGDVTKEETGKILTPTTKNTNDKPPAASHFAPDKGEDHGITFADNTKFDTLSYMVPPGGKTDQRGRGRAVFAGGYTGPSPGNGTTVIDYFNIQSGGITQSFGTLSEPRKFSAGLASATRGVFGGSDGTPSWSTGTMEYVTIATTSNTTSFGNMTQAGGMVSAHSNNTRGLFFSVWDANTSGSSHKKHIDYITIASEGNSADFGELSAARPEATGFGSSTRGICSGGYAALSPNAALDTIDYVTIATTGDATDFGNLTVARQGLGGASSETRGISAGGYANPTGVNTIDYVTIATIGNATDFGDSISTPYGLAQGNCSNKIRAVFVGGKTSSPTWTNSISYVNIATTGNASDFGDLTGTYGYGSVCSDSHGGI